jgi:hypothetical protein
VIDVAQSSCEQSSRFTRGEIVVRIITPEIINRMNQEPITNQDFDREWAKTLDRLEQHNKEIAEISPQSVVDFIQQIDLFNSAVLVRSGSPARDQYIFSVEQPEEKRIIYIGYTLAGEIQQVKHTGPGFDEGISVWLYDEFHKIDSILNHNIIFSDGIEYVIPFTTLHVRLTNWFED